MSRLDITGQVVYADLTPAPGADVRIIEVDAAPGGVDDRILRRTTDPDGRFSGRSSEWQDREGRVGPVEFPDIFRLRFEVRVDGRSHRGPFVLLGERSAPIVLPFAPPKPVGRTERELVQVILLSQGYRGGERELYRFIEDSAEGITRAVLGGSYGRVTIVRGEEATLGNFSGALRAATAGASVEAVDVIFTTHGIVESLVFADGDRSESSVREELMTLPAASRRKLRALFSTACFGVTHLDLWTALGFNEVSGAEGIYADSATTYAPMLAAWAAERTFAESIDIANASDVGDVNDNIARAYYAGREMRSVASRVNSHRKRAGTGRSRIYAAP